jgi:hypothetical protein
MEADSGCSQLCCLNVYGRRCPGPAALKRDWNLLKTEGKICREFSHVLAVSEKINPPWKRRKSLNLTTIPIAVDTEQINFINADRMR